MDAFGADADSETVTYEPIGVKDLLSAMKDSSELIVDLAYSALLHNSENLAEEVLQLEQQMDLLQLQARMNMLMATRNPDDARQLAPVLGIIGAAEKISDAAGDIAGLVLGEETLPGSIQTALPEAIEVLERATVDEDSIYAAKTLGEINLETETGVRVIGIRGENGWELDPDSESRLDVGDSLLLRGDEDSVAEVYQRITTERYEQPEATEAEFGNLERAVDTIVLMKNVSELAVDLAYASVLFDDQELAEEVNSLEVEVDSLHSRLEAWALQAAADVDDPVSLRGLLRLASSSELISDAALEITEGILRDIDTHPVIAESVRESDVAVRRAELGPNSSLAGRTVGTILDETPGVSIIAIHEADGEWIFYPDGEETVAAGDVLIVRGTWNATEQLLETAA
ncbi:potassium channel protein [Halovenus sp. WSH3]|uniref:Potassium channel protein n=1 Tax=Halovenus carboxidivorans TaxID=2692199 RepID=A0A6B0TD04_9EURY|nr:TrkA C-terminal domain-containing protein [Halovenus carboxidivorans]MXR53121.1 potassium channel protein [Halovenus carboxidivorans]